MQRGGYDSVEPGAALEQARLGDQALGYHRLFGIPGSAGEAIRLTVILAVLTSLVGSIAAVGALSLVQLPLAVGSTVPAALLAPLFANRLAMPWGQGWIRGLLWGLCCAAAFLITLRIVLAVVLVAWLRLHGIGADQAGVDAFHGAASFTLMLAMPAWFALAAWGLLRRRGGIAGARSILWRRAIAPIFIVLVMIFMGAEGAYMDSRPR